MIYLFLTIRIEGNINGVYHRLPYIVIVNI